jgi:spoIIIJ-associated protein
MGLGGEQARIQVRKLAMANKENDIVEVAKEVLEALLAAMDIAAMVTKGDSVPITFNIKGEDLGILIGRRGQTLASLQYIVRLIVSHRTGTWSPIVIDVEEYKQRRYQALQALAYRLAEQVKVKRRPFALEPMPAYERRIIHLALADHPDVATQSVGEGEARKVVIMLKGTGLG